MWISGSRRLTAATGWAAVVFSAWPPEDELISLTVERLKNGEVSPCLVDELSPKADQFLSCKKPSGAIWTLAVGGPVCLIEAGSGIAPLTAMLYHRHSQNAHVPAALSFSFEDLEGVIYRSELAAMTRRDRELRVTGAPPGKQPMGPSATDGRVDVGPPWPKRIKLADSARPQSPHDQDKAVRTSL